MFKRSAAVPVTGRLILVCLALGCMTLSGETSNAADTASTHQAAAHKKVKKQHVQLPVLPSGPTGHPVPQVPLDSIRPVPPQVSFQDGQLTIDAANSTLGDILRAVRKQTGAEIEIPEAQDRVVTHLGPGPARQIVAELLNGSRFNYVLLGSPENSGILTRVVLVAKSGPDSPAPANPAAPQAAAQAGNMAPPPQEAAQDANDADAADDNNTNMDENTEQPPAEAAEQSAPQGDEPAVKTPQQMLQEMQQRQMQFQQQLQQQGVQPGQPIPGPGMPQRPPQQPDQQ
jgi:hypothetical protein